MKIMSDCPRLRIAIPTKIQCNAKFTMSLLTVFPQIRSVCGYQPEVKFLCGKSNIDQARSMLATDWYNESDENDLFLFIDSDHVFKVKDIKKAIDMNSDVACGIYPNSAGRPTCFMMQPE